MIALVSFVEANEITPNISLDAGAWYMNWKQTSTASGFLKNSSDALDTTYKIDNSVASLVRLNLNYKFLNWNMEYYNNSFSSSKKDNIKGLNIALSILKFIPHMDVEMRYIKTDFQGTINSKSNSTGEVGSGIFETKLTIMDATVYPFNKYVGVGYRKYKYDVPQDVYIVRNSDDSLIGAGLIDVSYEGDFYTVSIDNKRLVDREINYNGIVYSASCGIGKLKPKTDGFEKWTTDSDATYYDIFAGYSYKKKSNKYGYGITTGYRYNKIDTKSNKTSGDYSLITEFNSEFQGPFINLNFSF
jgi:hypothetical protein